MHMHALFLLKDPFLTREEMKNVENLILLHMFCRYNYPYREALVSYAGWPPLIDKEKDAREPWLGQRSLEELAYRALYRSLLTIWQLYHLSYWWGIGECSVIVTPVAQQNKLNAGQVMEQRKWGYHSVVLGNQGQQLNKGRDGVSIEHHIPG